MSPPISLPNLRLWQNLNRLRDINLTVAVDVANADAAFNQSAAQAVESTVASILNRNGIRTHFDGKFPELEIRITVRPILEPVLKRQIAEYRVESALREVVSLSRPTKETPQADTWRHSADIRYAALTASSEASPAILNEVKLQIEAFASDWRAANGFTSEEAARGKGRDNLKGLLETVGPVFEKILNNLGIQTLIDLVDLEKDNDEEYIVLQELKARSPNFTDEKLKEWIAAAKKLLPPT